MSHAEATAYFRYLQIFDLARSYEDSMVRLAVEVRDAVDRPVVLPDRRRELDTDPFAGRERGRTTESYDASSGRNARDRPERRVCAHAEPVQVKSKCQVKERSAPQLPRDAAFACF
jgi:hypothetical protein